MRKINYAKEYQEHLRHVERWKEYVKKFKLTCQECGGSGKYVGDSIDFGGDDCGPIMFHIMETCDWCEGTGLIDPRRRGEWLRWKKDIKRMHQ